MILKENENILIEENLFHKQCPIQNKAGIMFMETTGLNESSYITILSITIPLPESTRVLQIFNNDGKSEKLIIIEFIKLIEEYNIECINITDSWFEDFFNRRLKVHNITNTLKFINRDITFSRFYGSYGLMESRFLGKGDGSNVFYENHLIKELAHCSIFVYESYLREKNEYTRNLYLKYNFDHSKQIRKYLESEGLEF